MCLLLAVVAAIRERPEEVQCLECGIAIEFSLGGAVIGDPLKASQNLFNNTMFVFEDFGR
jgi:hypothetical protein